MKRLLYFFIVLSIGFILSLNSCSEDSSPFVFSDAAFKSGTGLINSNTSVPIYTPIKINLSVAKGTNQLKTITVKLNGVVWAPLSFKINGVDAAANPQLLFNTNKDSITNLYEFNTLTDPGTILAEFIITDDKDSIVTKSITVTFTATSATQTGNGLVVYNFSGARNGGVDLFNAKVVAGTDPNAHIRDFGNVSMGNNTWVQKFTPLNGSIIKDPGTGLTFADISYVEDIIYLFDNGTNEVGSINTKVLSKNDFFIVKNQSTYFAVSIDNMNPTANDNLDNYVISIKK